MEKEPNCYQCGKPAEETENYKGIPIRVCEDAHRTGKALEGETGVDFSDVELIGFRKVS